MTRKFARNPLEELFEGIKRLQNDIDDLTNRKETTLPFRASNNLPPGVEGQWVIAEYVPPEVGPPVGLGRDAGFGSDVSILYTPTTGFSDIGIGIGFTVGTSFVSSPVSVAGTFHDGTTIGVWDTDITGILAAVPLHATWQVDVSAAITGSGHLQIYLQQDFGTMVEIFNATLSGSDTVTYSTTAIDPGNFGLLFQSPSVGSSMGIVGTMTFILI